MKPKNAIIAVALLAVLFFALCSPVYSQSELQGQPFYGMEVKAVTESPSQVIVETTGARYILSRTLSGTGMEMWRKIDPEINDINPKKVAKLVFDADAGAFTVISKNKGNVEITSNLLDFNFISDSFFTIKAKAPFTYTHTNLIQNAPWNKGSGLDRMWTDGNGGSLHAWIRGNPTAQTGTDYTRFTMSQNDEIAHMVFPPKTFDFEGLYGKNASGEDARPFVYFLYPSSTGGFQTAINNMGTYKDAGFGVFMIWNGIYDCGVENIECFMPVLLDSGILGYKIKAELDDTLNSFISLAHSKGFKVITYLSHPDQHMEGGFYGWKYPDGHPMQGVNNGFQDISITLAWMKKFQKNYSLDGWYFDNANVGDLIEDYNFIRQVRADVDAAAKSHGFDKGVIFHHDSVDIWGWDRSHQQYSGLRAIMINAYADYTVTGETGIISEVDSPNDPYMRFYSSGYGMSQAFCSHILTTNGKTAMTPYEKDRVLAENLNCAERSSDTSYLNYWQYWFKPSYDERRGEYLSDPNVDWPVPETGWFRTPLNIEPVEFITGTSVRISWETQEPSNSEVAYTSNGLWKTSNSGNPGPDGIVINTDFATNHSIILSGLKENRPYEFRIRSLNEETDLRKIVWGHVGSFTTGIADADGDGMNDSWEIQYFGNTNRDGSGNFDADGLTDLEEFRNNTDPTSKDSDADGFEDRFELDNGYDPLNWFDSPNTCKDDFICNQGLLGYWSFDFGEPIDQSGNNNNGIALGPQWIASGRYNGKGAYKFNGIGDYINIGQQLADVSTYGQANRKSTITAWVKPANVGRYNIVTQHLGGFDYFSAGTTDTSNPGKLRTMVRDGNPNKWPDSNRTIKANEWTHIAFVFEEGKGAKFYINGEPAGETTNNLFAFHNYGENAYIGSGIGVTDDAYFSGMIDEVTVWKRALSQEEILEIYTRHCGNSKCEPAQGETAENCPMDCTQECIREPELLGFIGQWKRGEISMLVLMQKIRQRNAGTGC